MNMGMAGKAKLKVLDEIEALLGDGLGSKLKKPDAVEIDIQKEGSPEEEALESPLEEKKEDEMMPDEDRISNAMMLSGKSPSMPGDEAEGSDDSDEKELLQKLLLMKKMKGA